MPSPLDHGEQFVFMEKMRVPDGMGGYKTSYVPGAEFTALLSLNSSIEARLAEQQGVTSVFTISVDKTVPLEYQDVLNRQSDGQTFRVTANPDDKQTPDMSQMDFKTASVEKYILPS